MTHALQQLKREKEKMWKDADPGVDLGPGFTDDDSDSGGSDDEIPVWVRGEQRFVSGVHYTTTCADMIAVLLQDEASKGRKVGPVEDYQITERWRGVEQPLDNDAVILDIWNAWGTAQSEVRILLRRLGSERPSSRRRRHHQHHQPRLTDSWGSGLTLHPKRLLALAATSAKSNGAPAHKGGSSSAAAASAAATHDLLKLVLAQGEIIRRQLRKLRHSEHQIGFLEDKTHRARVRKHGSNYLLEAYLKGLPDPAVPGDSPTGDKNSDSGVVTEGDCEQPPKTSQTEFERLSPEYSDEGKASKDDDSQSESQAKEQSELWEMIAKINKRLLKEEELLVRLHVNIKKLDRDRQDTDQVQKALTELRTEMTKTCCEMQHNAVVMEEKTEQIDARRTYLNELHRELTMVDQEYEMLNALLFSEERPKHLQSTPNSKHTKELNTLV